MQTVTLDTLGGGALAELFDVELARILANIADPNTAAEAKRAVTMTITFKPTRDRAVADVELKCISKLAGIVTVRAQLFMGRHQGKLVAVESDPRQTKLFDEAPRGLAAVGNFQQKDGEA